MSELTSEGLTEEEVSNIFEKDLRQGDYGERVRVVQYYLNVIAYFNPEIPMVTSDGVFNSAMDNQVKAFERFYGLTPDGVVDFRTWELINEIYRNIVNNLPEGYAGATAALYPGYNLTPGMRNDDVKEFQTYLRVIGQNIGQIPVIEATGYFGPETERAVMTFQRLYGIEPTGIVGALTWDTAAKEDNFIRFGTTRTG